MKSSIAPDGHWLRDREALVVGEVGDARARLGELLVVERERGGVVGDALARADADVLVDLDAVGHQAKDALEGRALGEVRPDVLGDRADVGLVGGVRAR